MAASVVGAAALVCGSVGVAALDAPPAVAVEEGTISSLVNQARWAAGLPGLSRNADMDRVALAWAQEMASNGTMEHNPDYDSQIPAGWRAAAENVAQGQPSASALHGAWMSSQGHRANILGDYTDIGIAYINANGTTWGVEVFAKYPGHSGPTAPKASTPGAEPAPDAPGGAVSPADPGAVGDESEDYGSTEEADSDAETAPSAPANGTDAADDESADAVDAEDAADAAADAAAGSAGANAGVSTEMDANDVEQGYVPVPRGTSSPRAALPSALSDLPAAVLSRSMTPELAHVGAGVGVLALIVASTALLWPRVRRWLGTRWLGTR